MFAYWMPLAMVVISNLLYQISTKSVPDRMNPLASLTVTYLVGAAASAILYYVLNTNADISEEYTKLNWAPFLLGLSIVGLEVGYILAFKSGWAIGTFQIVQAAALAVILVFVGYFAYHEALTWHKIIGVLVCLVGLTLINL